MWDAFNVLLFSSLEEVWSLKFEVLMIIFFALSESWKINKWNQVNWAKIDCMQSSKLLIEVNRKQVKALDKQVTMCV